jgi:hypothetical protein
MEWEALKTFQWIEYVIAARPLMRGDLISSPCEKAPSLCPKNKVEKNGKFSKAEKVTSTHHEPPPNHHNFTTKNHTQNTFF